MSEIAPRPEQPEFDPDKRYNYDDGIDRTPQTIRVNIGERALLMTYDNTELFEFPDYPDYDHVFHNLPDAKSMYIFTTDTDSGAELFDTLEQMGYPIQSRPYPSKTDAAVRQNILEQQLRNEIDEFSDTGEM